MSLRNRLLTAAGLSVLLLPLGLLLNGGLSLAQLALLFAFGTLLGLSRPAFAVLVGGAALSAVFIAACLFTPLLPNLARSLVVDEPPREADLIVVLGGGMHCGARHLEASSLARLEKGLELWRSGYAPRVSLSDTVGEIFGDANCPSLGTEAARRVRALYADQGPEIVFLRRMRTTRTEALAVAELARERGYRTVITVSAPVHTRRVAETFRKLGRETGLDVVSVASAEPRFDMAMVKPMDRLMAIPGVTREILGLLTYRMRGWI